MDGESRRTGCMLWQHCIDPVSHWGLRPRRGPPYARATRGRTESERCASMASRKERMGSSVRGEGKEVGGDSATGRAYMSCLHSNPGPCDAMQRWLACPTVARIGSEPILSCHAPLLRIPRDHPPPYFRACLRVAQRSLRPRKPCTHLQALQWPCPRRTMARPDFLPAADHDLSSRTAQLCTERPDGRRNIRTCPTWIPLSTDRNRRQSPKNPWLPIGEGLCSTRNASEQSCPSLASPAPEDLQCTKASSKHSSNRARPSPSFRTFRNSATQLFATSPSWMKRHIRNPCSCCPLRACSSL